MKLTSCPRCERLVRVESPSCPFCDTRLGTTSSLTRAMLTAAVGLSLTACVDKDGMDTGADAGPTMESSSSSSPSTDGPATTTAPTTGFTSGITTDTPTSSEGGHGFDGAGDTYTGPGIPPEETTTTGASSGSSDSGSGSGTDSGSGTGGDSDSSGTSG